MQINNVGVVLENKYIQQALVKGIEYNVPPSVFICQWWFESRFGTTKVAKENNNWGGTSYFYKTNSYKRKSGVTVYRGTPRPKSEGSYYMKFSSVDDYLIDYFYLLLEQGIYNITNKSNFDDAVKGLFKVGGAKNNYAVATWDYYLKTMQGIRYGINKRNDNILDKIDGNPKQYLDGSYTPSNPNDPVPTPEEPEEIPPSNGIDYYDKYNKDVANNLNDIIGSDLFNIDFTGKTFGNDYIKVIKQYDNMYKVQVTKDFGKSFSSIIKNGLDNFEDIFQGITGRPEKPVEDDNTPVPAPEEKKYFPVDYKASGINFWKKSNWKLGQLQYQMCYGYTRNNGTRFHSGYDIGGGGGTNHKVYSIVKSKVEFITNSSSGGFMIQLKHLDDNYYTTYMHLKSNSNMVNVGDIIDAGKPIAIMGNTPTNMGYAIHLHLVLSKDGSTNGVNKTYNPEKYLGIIDDNKTSLKNPV